MPDDHPSLADQANALLAECRQLRDEIQRLRLLLEANDIDPDPPKPAPASSPAPARKVISTEQKIALFRSLFRGREDVFALRWEAPDGRHGYSPRQSAIGKHTTRAGPKIVSGWTKRRGSTFRFRTKRYTTIWPANRPSAFIRFYTMRPAGSWQLILTRRVGSATPTPFEPPATISEFRRRWSGLARGRALTFGSSSNAPSPQ